MPRIDNTASPTPSQSSTVGCRRQASTSAATIPAPIVGLSDVIGEATAATSTVRGVAPAIAANTADTAGGGVFAYAGQFTETLVTGNTYRNPALLGKIVTTLDVMAVLQKFPNVRPHPEAFVEALEALQPRLYSISSSHNATPGKLSLTVDCVRYLINKRKRLGLASTFLAERIQPGDEVKVYVQKAHGFALPEDPKVPIIMIGPGTGIAPFRAFLHDRRATGAPGKNWLFFGHQRSDCDFFYADELNAMKTSGLLTRLSLAWSRDGDKKFYVQDRMREVGREVWTWLAEGANIYICGDAKRMAKDVERALVDIVAQFGARSTDEAVLFVAELKKKGRFQQDVY